MPSKQPVLLFLCCEAVYLLNVSRHTSIIPETFCSYSQKAPWMSQQQRARLTLPWSDTAWPPLSASEPAVLWEPLRQLTLAVSDADQNGPAVTRWSLRFCGSYYQTRGGMEGWETAGEKKLFINCLWRFGTRRILIDLYSLI